MAARLQNAVTTLTAVSSPVCNFGTKIDASVLVMSSSSSLKIPQASTIGMEDL